MKQINCYLIMTISMFFIENVCGQLPEFTRIDTGIIHTHIDAHFAAGWVDIDQDSDMDLIISNAGMFSRNKPNLLYRNERSGKFIRINDASYTKTPIWTAFPGPFGDIDNDGDEDIILSGWDEPVNHIFKNDSYGNLEKMESYSIPNPIAAPFLLDINNNSFLDLVLIGSDGYILYNDSSGSFHDPVRINILETEEYLFHGGSWGDADDDGDMDIFCGYSYLKAGENPGKNALYINNGGGDFQKYNDTAGYFTDMAMTPSTNWIDYDNDNDMDLFVLNSWEYMNPASELSKLYINTGNLQFEKYIFEPGIYKDSHKNSSAWADIDNDGDLDLYITIEKNDFGSGGHVSPTKYNLLFENQGNGQLTEITNHALVNESSHGITFTDHDNDGDLDVLLIRYSWSNDGQNTFFTNEGNSNSWINLKCVGTHSNKSAFGTKITAKAFLSDSLITQSREITPVHGHGTYPSSRVHFGLADAETVDSLIIRWPSGHVDTWLNVPSRQFYRAIEDSILEIDFRATNYIQLDPVLADVVLTEAGELLSIDLNTHYQFMKGDSVPEISGDTLSFTLHSNDNLDVVHATLEGSILSLEAGTLNGTSMIQVTASAGFTKRMDEFIVTNAGTSLAESNQIPESITFFPNPTGNRLTIEMEYSNHYSLEINSLNGQPIYTGDVEGTVHQIDLSSFQSGVYFITIRSKDFVTTKKIIKL